MTDIPINPVTRRVQFAGTTGTGPFAFNFNILQATDIVVLKNNVVLSIGTGSTNYSVSIASNGTGSVSLVTALISSDTLIIMGGRELSRTTDFVTAGDLLASSLNEQLDSNVVMSQQIDEKVNRSIIAQPGDKLVGINLSLPLVADRANEVIKFDASGNVTTIPVSEIVGADIDTQKITIKTSAGATKLVINGNIADLITAADNLIIASTSGDIDFKPGGGQINLLSGTGAQRMSFDNTAQPTMQYFQASNVTKLGVVDPTATRTILLPNASDTLVGKATTDTLTNKTLASPVITGSLAVGTLTGSGDILLDAVGDIVLDAAGDQVFFKDGGTLRITFNLGAAGTSIVSAGDLVTAVTNGSLDFKTSTGNVSFLKPSGGQAVLVKSDSTPTIQYFQNSNTTELGVVNPTATRTILFPDASDTLVGKATTDTLTNKTLTSPTITGGLNMSDVNITNVGTISLDRIASDSGAGINLDSTGIIVIDSANGQTIFKQNGSTRLTFTTSSSGLQTLTSAGIFSLTATSDINLRPNGGQLYILRNNGGDNFQFNTSSTPTLAIHQNSNRTNLGLVNPTATRNILFPDASDTLVGKATTDTLTNKTITSPVLNTGVSGSAFLDEDNFASNSATKIASQQSIKAYVDAATAGGGAGSLSTVLGIGNTTGSNNVLFGDNNKAIFGAGSDLQIYHDGSHSRIDEQGTGVLFLQTNGTNIQLNKGTSENMLVANVDGSVDLYHNGTKKFETSATGVTVSGAATLSSGQLNFAGSISDPNGAAYIWRPADNTLAFGTANEERMRIDGSGTTTFASEPNAPSFKATDFMDIRNDDAELYFTNAANNRYARFRRDNTHNDIDLAFFNGSGTTNKFKFRASGDLQIADGNLVVGTSGHGIDFSADSHASGMQSEVLDDYEEGTCTLSWSGTGTAGPDNANFKYVRVGSFVSINGSTASTLPTPTGQIGLTGLPFAANGNSAGSILYRNISPPSNQVQLVAYVGSTSTEVQPYWAGSVNYARLDKSDFNSTVADIYFSLNFRGV